LVFFLVYVPFTKISHDLYYPFARYALGRTLGSGGDGLLSMAEFRPLRLESAKVKAEQLRATGAALVCTMCHNCVDGLTDVIRHDKLNMRVVRVLELVAKALVEQIPRRRANGAVRTGGLRS
jgi:hypothetical protein